MLLAGLEIFAGLLHHSGSHLVDGGDLGNGIAGGLLYLLGHIVGPGARYACAEAILAAISAIGFLMVTDRPLVHWAGLIRLLFQAIGRWLPSRRPRSDVHPSLARTVASSRRRTGATSNAVSAADLDLPGSRNANSTERPTIINGAAAPDYNPVGQTPEDLDLPPLAKKKRGAFARALDSLLPQAEPDPPAKQSIGEYLGISNGVNPGSGLTLEEISENSVTHVVGGPDGTTDENETDDGVENEDGEPDLSSRRSRRPARSSVRPESSSTPTPPDTSTPLPTPSLLTPTPPPTRKSDDESRATVMTLERTLQEFKVEAKVVEIAEGPTLTRYEIQLAPGILVKKILSLADNISMALAAIDVRVEAPIPGKSAIGIEVPRRSRGLVGLREMVDRPDFQKLPRLSFALGKDVTGAPQYADLTRMPHLLIAGSTGSGKSACLNTLITSLLYRLQPEELQFVMIDPKRVELSLYDGIPHLCHQIVRDCRRAPQALGRVMAEMDRRYLLLQEARTRDITGFNAKMEEPDRRLPYIVVIIDELADLMMTSGAETEHAITRLAQLARAVGIHLVVATQRPSVDIVTGKIKANISSRIAFAVSSGVDSRTILDCIGAERLIGQGDMLFIPIDANKPRRIQGAYIGERELEQVVDFWKAKGRPDYYLERTPAPGADLEPTGDATDELYGEAVRVVINAGQASTSMLQRRLKIGYNRAATLIELMEEHSVVGPQDGVRPREVLISLDQWERASEG